MPSVADTQQRRGVYERDKAEASGIDATRKLALERRGSAKRNANRPGRNRTCNPRFWRPVLYQLSYGPLNY
jgi:hypothetical protein